MVFYTIYAKIRQEIFRQLQKSEVSHRVSCAPSPISNLTNKKKHGRRPLRLHRKRNSAIDFTFHPVQKGYGEWMPWMKDNLEFSRFSAERYMKVYEIREDKFKSVLNLTQVYQSLVEHKPIRGPGYNLQQTVKIGKDVYEVGPKGEYIGIIPEAEVVPEPIRDGGDTESKEEPVYSAIEFPETSALKEGQSRNLALLKDAWLRANKEDRKRFLKWLQKRNELKISKGRKSK